MDETNSILKAHNAINLIGKTFNRLTVQSYAGKKDTNHSWLCLCSCGNTTIVTTTRLLSKIRPTQSCGCLCRENTAKAHLRHGACVSEKFPPEYIVWAGIIQRCRDENCQAYPRYGGRGISVCERWQGREGFANFLADMGRKPSAAHQLDRTDNNGNYCPENCRWATCKEQGRNKRNNRLISCRGMTKTLSAWSEESKIHRATITERLELGWDAEKAIFHPVDERRKRKPKA